MKESEPKTSQISWEGDSLHVLKSFPEAVRMEIGTALRKLQTGNPVTNIETRSMRSIGSGVYELKDSDASAWYRVIYVSKIDDVIYVLHSFEKDSRKTDGRDVETATKRFKKVQERLQEAKKAAKKESKSHANKK